MAESYIEFRIGNSQKGYMDSSSNLFAFGSMRSPIFYDSNNTTYFLDPGGDSGVDMGLRGRQSVDTQHKPSQQRPVHGGKGEVWD